MKKKKIVSTVLNVGWVIALAQILAQTVPLLYLGYAWAYALALVITGSCHYALVNMALNLHCLVRRQESLVEGVPYMCTLSPFFAKNGVILRLTRAVKKQDGYGNRFFAVTHNYYCHSYDPKIFDRLGESGECAVKLHEEDLILIEP